MSFVARSEIEAFSALLTIIFVVASVYLHVLIQMTSSKCIFRHIDCMRTCVGRPWLALQTLSYSQFRCVCPTQGTNNFMDNLMVSLEQNEIFCNINEQLLRRGKHVMILLYIWLGLISTTMLIKEYGLKTKI